MCYQLITTMSFLKRLQSFRDRMDMIWIKGTKINAEALTELEDVINSTLKTLTPGSICTTEAVVLGIEVFYSVEEKRKSKLRKLDPRGPYPSPPKEYAKLERDIGKMFKNAVEMKK
jgi:hypothetical protein